MQNNRIFASLGKTKLLNHNEFASPQRVTYEAHQVTGVQIDRAMRNMSMKTPS